MRETPQVTPLRDGRLQLHHGPIHCIVEAFGAPAQVREAYGALAQRFSTVLEELCAELTWLRQPAKTAVPHLCGSIARRMAAAVEPWSAEAFITPMAAVAGAVAEELLEAMTNAADLERAYVNDGGDIAIHLGEARSMRVALAETRERPSLFGAIELSAEDSVRGVATSGWRGRSFSLGIADAVTVLADTAAGADAAATMIANAVDLPNHPAIARRPARDLAPDSDLGELAVTCEVGALGENEVEEALDRGAWAASEALRAGLIRGAALRLAQQTRIALPGSSHAEASQRSLIHA